MCQAGDHTPANRLVTPPFCGRLRSDGCELIPCVFKQRKATRAVHGDFEEHSGEEKHVVDADACYKTRCERATEYAAERPTRTDKTEESLALFAIESVRHQTPENGDDEQTEHGRPDKKRTPNVYVQFRRYELRHDEEEKQVRDEEAVGERNKTARGKARDEK